MNAQPVQITVSLAISSKYTLEAIEELYAGINLACENYKVDLVGGDTTSSVKGLTISITAIGLADEKEIVYRNGAQVNDLVCVTGNIGGAYAGLQLLEREKQLFMENPNVQPDLEGHDYVLERQLKPEPRADSIRQLKEQEIQPTAMIDISDGLASEILHICQQSDVGCRLMANKLPIDQGTYTVAEELGLSAYTMALNGGEDYELLFTVNPAHYDKLLNIPDVSIIGFITEKSMGYQLMDDKNNALPIYAQGWDSFLKK
jgi:thiamine-monophosphate kinase